MLGLWLVCMHDRHCRMLWSEYRRSRRKAWIEIENMTAFMNGLMVAPFMGAWIEIGALPCHRGRNQVAPFMGAWIEISKYLE